jgi:hypothetical protein
MVTPDLMSEEDMAKLIVPDNLSDEQSTLTAYIEVKVYDKDGHIIQHHRQPMRSATQYLLALVSIPLIGTYSSSSSNQATGILVNILGLPSQQSTYTSSSTGVYLSANILWDFSIQLGSGTQAFNPTLSSLAAPIANGSGAGQLSYGSVTITYSGASINTYVTVINYSTTTINVTEIGLTATVYIQYATGSSTYTYNTYTYLLTYDVFSQPVTLPPGGIATFEVVLSFEG